MKKTKLAMAGMMAAAILLTGASQAQAALTSVQIQSILNLLSSFGADSQVIQNVDDSLNGRPLTYPTSSSSEGATVKSGVDSSSDKSLLSTGTVASCYGFERWLYTGKTDGESGGDVSRLQRFLKEKGYYSYPEITGYYGPATEEAVKRFQVANNVISQGDPETTGYGSLGPKTRVKINQLYRCGQTTQPFITVLSPNGGETYKVGNDIVISWSASNIVASDSFKVSIINSVGGSVLETGVSSSNRSWGMTISSSMSPGQYKAVVSSQNTGATDSSNSFFTITAVSSTQSSITLTKNVNLGNQTIADGTAGTIIGSFVLTAGPSEDIRVNTIRITLPLTGASAITNLRLREHSTGEPVATARAVPSTVNSFSISNLVISAGQSKTIHVYVDTKTGYSGIEFTPVVDGTAVGMTSGNSVNFGKAGESLQMVKIIGASAPSILNAQQLREFSVGEEASLYLETSSPALCRYSANANTLFSSMTPLSNSGEKEHRTSVGVITEGHRDTTYFVKCMDKQNGLVTENYDITILKALANSQPSIIVLSPNTPISWKRNTLGEWRWLTSGSVSTVDIYLVGEGTHKWTFAKNYPNHGTFSWAVGFASEEWNLPNGVPGGDYTIYVCPSGVSFETGSRCGSFRVNVYGDTPTITIASPNGGETFAVGGNITVNFSHTSSGEKYKINLLKPAIVSPVVYTLGTIVGGPAGVESKQFAIPSTVPTGTYTLEVVQLGNQGECLNVCAIAESASFTITAATTAPSVTLTATPSTITVGESVNLSWSANNVTSCTKSGAWSQTNVLTSGSQTIGLASTATFTVTCTGAGGSDTKSVTVTVNPAPNPDSNLVCGSYGDVDGDGWITEKDEDVIRNHVLGISKMTDAQIKLADVSANGVVSTLDISHISGYLAGTRTTFPVCATTFDSLSESQKASILESIRRLLGL
ncbi:MAG: peptidoglycan-binding protein [bacterium]|nr:peptidoglycan-binding protein [bacterium]